MLTNVVAGVVETEIEHLTGLCSANQQLFLEKMTAEGHPCFMRMSSLLGRKQKGRRGKKLQYLHSIRSEIPH